MSKVHITLVGAQAAPVYYGISATKPDKVVFVYSSQTQHVMKAVIAELDSSIEVCDGIVLEDNFTPHQIKNIVESLTKKYAEETIVVNISGGMKSWSHFFSIVFDPLPNASVVYVDQNNILWNLSEMTSENIEFDMQRHFRLYGNPLKKFRTFADYTETDFKLIERVKVMRMVNVGDFNKLTSLDLSKQQTNCIKNNQSGELTLPSGSSVKWFRDNSHQWVVELGLVKKGKKVSETFISEHVLDIVFFSGWFELYVAKLLSTWDRAKEICLNCCFPSVKNINKNEVDIIVNTGAKILFVECKTQISTSTDIDKFRTVVKEYGGTGSKGIFVTDADITDVAQEKCDQQNLLHVSVGTKGLLSPEAKLRSALDFELNNINAK